MVLFIPEIGLKISKKVTELKLGPMEQDTTASIKMDKKMDLENSYGLMVLASKEISIRTILTEEELTTGLIKDSILESGKIIRCMAQVFSLGMMVENIMESILMTKKKVKVSLNGPMERNTRENG